MSRAFRGVDVEGCVNFPRSASENSFRAVWAVWVMSRRPQKFLEAVIGPCGLSYGRCLSLV